MESTIKACGSGINSFSACTIKTSQVEARCYIGGRHRPSKGEYAPILLNAIMAAQGRADVVARSLLAIMPGTDRTDEERARWDEWQEACIAEAARFEALRAARAASLAGNVAAYAYTGSADAKKAAEAAQEDLARLKNAQKQRRAPVGLCVQGACTVDGASAILIQIDLDKDGIVERGMTIEDAEDAMDADPHVLTHWRSRRGEGVQGLAVCADDEVSWCKARAAILAAYPADEAALCKEIRGARSHSIVCLPGTDKGACEMWIADECERKAFAAENEIKSRAIAIPATARPRPRGESIFEAAAKAWRASDLAEYIATKKGEVATSKKGGAEWIVGKSKGKGSISVREIDGRAVAKDFADGAPQRDAVDWVMELEGLRDKGEAARRAAEIVGLTLPERKTASRRAPSSGTAEAEENAPAGRRRKGWKEKMRDYLSGYKFDTFAGKLHTPEGKVMDVDHLASVLWNTFDEVSRAGAYEAIDMLVRQNPARWVDSLEMRARALADCYTVADRGAIARYCERCGFDEYEAARIRMWLCAAIGRAVWRGEKVDNMLVLAGEAEGTRKTDFFDAVSEVLCGEGAAEVDLSAGKDTDLLLAARPVVVVDEIDKILGKVNAAQLKTRITQTTSCVRAPYDREAKTRRTAAVFGATTNVSAPIPAGEGEARRYWVIRVTREMGLEEGEAGAMLREAARDTLDALQSATGKRSARGKIWVETAEEAAETCRRNQSCKAEDAATIAIATGLAAIAEYAPTQWDEVRTATAISAAIETGDGKAIGLDGLRWTPTRASAAAIRAVMKARHLRGIHKIAGRVVKGYRLRDVAAEFCPDVRPKTDPRAETFNE